MRHRHSVHAEDPAATLRRVEELGGRVVMPLTEVAKDTTVALFADPEGHIVGLMWVETPLSLGLAPDLHAVGSGRWFFRRIISTSTSRSAGWCAPTAIS